MRTLLCPLPQSQPFLPTVVDGVLLPKMPQEILAQKLFNFVPYMVGFNRQEFGWLLPMVSTRASPAHPRQPPRQPPAAGLSFLLLQTLPGPRAAVPFACVDISMETFSEMAQLIPE